MLKTLSYGFKALQLSWKANGYYAILSVVSKIYETTFYPFIQIVLIAHLLDLLGKSQKPTFKDLSFIALFYLLASIVKILLTSFLDVKQQFLDTKLEAYIDLSINKKLTELDPATFESPDFQDLLAQIDGVKGTLQMHLIRFTGLINAVVQFITAAVVISIAFPLFAPLLIIATIPSYLMWDKFRVETWAYYVEKRTQVTRITQYVKNLLSTDSTSKEAAIFNIGSNLVSKVKTQQKTYFTHFNKAISPYLTDIILARCIQLSILVYELYVYLAKVLQGALGIGQFTLYFQQTITLAFAAEEILNQYSSISIRNKYLDKFFNFMNTKQFIPSPVKPLPLVSYPNPPVIEFKNVSFRYPKSERYILKDFNLIINSSEKIAIVGENGAGKTTIIKLLLRFYDANEGEILINGINIKDLNLDEWHTYIGALFQDFIKYQFTLKENIYFGDITKPHTLDFLKNAVEKSGADKYIENLPKGYEQIVGKMFDGGIDLSGGQWQKLALARAFFRNSPILILDEPTSAIDAKAEYEIFEKVQALQKDKTVIIISHRFSTVRNADRILVIDEGKVIEEGAHEQLMKKRGLYAELFNIQAKGYK